MKIAEIREMIDTLNWTRNDLSGHTRDEFKRADVPGRLRPKIEACRALVIPARFARDIERRDHAIASAEKMIARWQGSDSYAIKVPESKPVRLRLVVDNTRRQPIH